MTKPKPSDPTLEELPHTPASMDHTWPDDVDLDPDEARVDHLWAAVEVFGNYLRGGLDPRPDHPDRYLHFVVTVIPKDAARLMALLGHFGIRRVADLGAGDCRLALRLERRGFDVVAYELNEVLANAIRDRFDLGSLDLRVRDYYADFEDHCGPGRAVVCFGGTNELPYVPDEGLAVQGYWERGITAWFDGEVVARW